MAGRNFYEKGAQDPTRCWLHWSPVTLFFEKSVDGLILHFQIAGFGKIREIGFSGCIYVSNFISEILIIAVLAALPKVKSLVKAAKTAIIRIPVIKFET